LALFWANKEIAPIFSHLFRIYQPGTIIGLDKLQYKIPYLPWNQYYDGPGKTVHGSDGSQSFGGDSGRQQRRQQRWRVVAVAAVAAATTKTSAAIAMAGLKDNDQPKVAAEETARMTMTTGKDGNNNGQGQQQWQGGRQ
jgi:hypothetical protein